MREFPPSRHGFWQGIFFCGAPYDENLRAFDAEEVDCPECLEFIRLTRAGGPEA